MFPIRRPCADVVRSGISILWSSASSPVALYSTNYGLCTGRIFLKQLQLTRRSLFTSSLSRGGSSSDNQVCSGTSSTTSNPGGGAHTYSQHSPPTLTAVLREAPFSSSAAGVASSPLNHPGSSFGGGVEGRQAAQEKNIQFAASPKGKAAPQEEPQRQPNKGGGDPNKPNADQLLFIYNELQKSLERTFTHPMNYQIYHPDILFIDNIRNVRTQGLTKYMQQVAWLKVAGHVKFAYVHFDILNMSMSQEEGRVTVRWRIKGLSGIRVMLKFWKYKLWKWQEIMKNQETWHDGISYFDVNGDGVIVRHVADKVMEDKDRSLDEKSTGGPTIPFAAKLGGALGATALPTPSLSYHNSSSAASPATSSRPTTPSRNGGGAASSAPARD